MRAATALAIALLLLPLVPTAAAAQTSKREFIANQTDVPFGFDYDEDVDDCISDDCATFEGTDGDFAYLGTGLDSGKRAYEVTFEIEAQTEGKDSVMDVVFSQVDAIPSATSKGDGLETESFANAVKARFTETGDDWSIRIVETVNGAEHVLGTATTPDANDAHTYRFRVDANDGKAIVKSGSGGTLLAADFSNDLDQPFHAIWYVGYSTGFFNADTFLYLPPTSPTSSEVLDVDPLLPELTEPTQTPDSVAVGQAATIKTTVTDDWGISSVRLLSWVNGTQQAPITMSRTGDLFTGTLPARPSTATVRYQVEAKDVSDLTNTTETFEYKVGGGGRHTVSSGGGGGLFGAGDSQGAILLGVVVGAIGVALFILVRRTKPGLALTLLLAGVGFGLVIALGGIALANLGDQLANVPWYAWLSLLVPVGLFLYIRSRKA